MSTQGYGNVYTRHNTADRGDRYVDEFGREFYWNPTGQNPFRGGLGTYQYMRTMPGFGNAGVNLGSNTTMNPNDFNAAMGKINGLFGTGNIQRPTQPPLTTGPNPDLPAMRNIREAMMNWRPATSLPPALQARLDTMKSAALANLEHQSREAGGQVAGMTFENFLGEPGSGGDYYKARLGGEIGRARGDLESNFAQQFLNELNQQNQSSLQALGMAGSQSGSTAGVAGNDLDRYLQAQMGDRSYNQTIDLSFLNNAFSQERDRQGLIADLIRRQYGF